MNIAIAGTVAELDAIVPVLLQLRPQYTRKSLIAQIRQQQAGGYQVAYLEMDGRIVCVAGFVIGEKLAWGKHLYVDDLVTDGQRRSQGAGKEMLGWLIQHARNQGCRELHLDSGMQRHDAHRFYAREGLAPASLHFSITDLSDPAV